MMMQQMSPCLAMARAGKVTPISATLGRTASTPVLSSRRMLQLNRHRPRPSSRYSNARSICCSTNGHSSTNGRTTALNGNTPAVDAILILAGGFKADGSLPPWVTRRLDLAHDVYTHQQKEVPIVCLGGGTPHKPPIIDDRGYVVHEATMCSHYLLDKGVPPSSLLKEISSYDTVGNTYFSLAIHAIPAGWRRLAVVTSDFHMPRTRQLFDDMYNIASRSLYGQEGRFELSYFSASDEGLFDEETYLARVDKEARSTETWEKTKQGIHSMRELHAWLHDGHLCYAVGRQHEFGVPTIKDAKLLASY